MPPCVDYGVVRVLRTPAINRDHLVTYAAIETGDSSAAGRTARLHLTSSIGRYLGMKEEA